MTIFPSRTLAIVITSLALSSAEAAPSPAPVFAPNPSVGWISLSGDFGPPESGPGPEIGRAHV